MSASELRKTAWAKLGDKWGFFALITLIDSVILSAAGSTGIGALIVAGPLTVAFYVMLLKNSRGEQVAIENLFDGFKDFVRTFLLHLLNGLFAFLWALLFIIPGIIAELKYSMSYFILAENPELTANEARLKSIEMMNGHKWKLFCLWLSFIGWIILIPLTLGILSFWVVPYITAAEAEFYNNLKAGTL